MCGLTGYVGHDDQASFDLEAAMDFLRQRGPDERGAYRAAGASLGHTRLAVIDLSSGQQPMPSADGRHVLIFNGEIYNYQALRSKLAAAGARFRTQSDSEVLLELFLREGFERCLEQLRGMFAFAILDTAERTLYMARDRIGKKPLVYAETERGFLFASEIGALFALDPRLSRAVDARAIDYYLTYRYVPSPRTGFSAVRKLPPAHAMVVKDGQVKRIWRYWHIDPARRSSLSFQEACEGLREKLLEATRLRMIADVPLGAFLSGGVDSSITVAAMARLSDRPVKTFAVGFAEEEFSELPFAARVAKHLGTEHCEIVVESQAAELVPMLVEHYGEPFGDDSALPSYLVAKAARQHVTVALTGDGGDEAFAGYKRYYQIHLLERLERLRLGPAWRGARRLTAALEAAARKRKPAFPATRADQMLYLRGLDRYKHLYAIFPDDAKHALYTPAFRRAVGSAGTTDYLEAHVSERTDVTRYLLLDMETFLPDDVLFKVDIASMQASLECRSPFLDHEVMEFAASLPGRYKLGWLKHHKRILKSAFARWLPPATFERRKQGFSAPVSKWLRHDLWPMVQSRLLAEKTLAPWLDQAAVERYALRHRSGEAPNGKIVWTLLMLAQWVRQMKVET